MPGIAEQYLDGGVNPEPSFVGIAHEQLHGGVDVVHRVEGRFERDILERLFFLAVVLAVPLLDLSAVEQHDGSEAARGMGGVYRS